MKNRTLLNLALLALSALFAFLASCGDGDIIDLSDTNSEEFIRIEEAIGDLTSPNGGLITRCGSLEQNYDEDCKLAFPALSSSFEELSSSSDDGLSSSSEEELSSSSEELSSSSRTAITWYFKEPNIVDPSAITCSWTPNWVVPGGDAQVNIAFRSPEMDADCDVRRAWLTIERLNAQFQPSGVLDTTYFVLDASYPTLGLITTDNGRSSRPWPIEGEQLIVRATISCENLELSKLRDEYTFNCSPLNFGVPPSSSSSEPPPPPSSSSSEEPPPPPSSSSSEEPPPPPSSSSSDEPIVEPSSSSVTQTPVITITTNPTSRTVTQGSITGSLTCAATVSPSATVTYQWYSNTTSSNVGGTVLTSAGATTASFTIPANLTAGTYYYFCEARSTGADSKRSSVATVTVSPQAATPVITITTNPTATTTVTQGSITGSLTCAATVSPSATVTYQWYSNTTNSSTGGTVLTSAGATTASFTIPTTLTAGTYYYFCEARSTGADSKRSSVATVTVNAAQVTPVISITTQPVASTSVTQGSITGSLSVTASVTGGATLSYQWYSNTTNSNTGGTLISGATSASYTIPTNLTAGTYRYYVVVSATGGAVSVPSSVATVTVNAATGPIEIICAAQAVGGYTALLEGTHSYTVSASCGGQGLKCYGDSTPKEVTVNGGTPNSSQQLTANNDGWTVDFGTVKSGTIVVSAGTVYCRYGY